MAFHKGNCVGTILSKLDNHLKPTEQVSRKRGYIAMLSVEPEYRRIGLGRKLVEKSIDLMV